MPVVLIAAKNTPSNVPSRSVRARYMRSVEGSEVVVMGVNLEIQFRRFHRKMNTEFDRPVRYFLPDNGGQMADDLKDKWASIEKELKVAMAKLSDAIEKAREELPEAAKAINEEYLRMQKKLDETVAKIRK
jgi:hypothetical protein